MVLFVSPQRPLCFFKRSLEWIFRMNLGNKLNSEFVSLKNQKEWVFVKNRYNILTDVIIWLLFIKGIVLIPITLYTTWKALFRGTAPLIVGIASCAAGTFALSMSCVAIWLESKLE